MRGMKFLIRSSKTILLSVLTASFLIAWLTGSNQDLSPIKSVNTLNERSTESIWENMSHEFNLDHRVQSSQVQAEIRKLLANQDEFNHALRSAAPYIYFIYHQTRARGLPAEIALIPMIESEFNPNDRSNKGATGLWQLIPETAHDLGIKIKSSYDGRRNVIASTKAALAYFNDLGNTFKGNWYLAIAAYNCGEFRVQHAIKHAGTHNFWNLSLPRETKYYVPRLLAVAAIVENPKKYGVTLPPINNEPYFAEVKVKKAVNLTQVAKSSGTSVETLHTLNPDYNHGASVPDKKGTYTLLVPVKKAPIVKEQLANHIVVA